MGISAVSLYGNNNNSVEKDKQNLGKDDFLKLLITQMKYQDPLSPMEDTEYIAQMAQFSSLEQMQNLNSNIQLGLGYLTALQEELLLAFESWQAVNSGMNLIGKEISGITAAGDTVTGVVEKVRFTSQGTLVVVNGIELNIHNILEIAPVVQPETQSEIAGEENE
ncbi:MAG: flagellar hook assembly protein FlgD [Clostridia bacterium]|nr:flagellar hook assembly protein FlgD [Clostridia bacterium]